MTFLGATLSSIWINCLLSHVIRDSLTHLYAHRCFTKNSVFSDSMTEIRYGIFLPISKIVSPNVLPDLNLCPQNLFQYFLRKHKDTHWDITLIGSFDISLSMASEGILTSFGKLDSQCVFYNYFMMPQYFTEICLAFELDYFQNWDLPRYFSSNILCSILLPLFCYCFV